MSDPLPVAPDPSFESLVAGEGGLAGTITGDGTEEAPFTFSNFVFGPGQRMILDRRNVTIRNADGSSIFIGPDAPIARTQNDVWFPTPERFNEGVAVTIWDRLGAFFGDIGTVLWRWTTLLGRALRL